MLFLSVHAFRQMQRRSISRDEVAQVIALHDTMYPSAEDPSRTVLLGRTATERRLKVVVETANYEVVVTVADRDREE